MSSKKNNLTEAAETLACQGWMDTPGVRAVMRALNPSEGVPQALFVGGCVRDAYLGRPFTDIDIACVHLPKDTIALLEAAGIKAIPTGVEYGTITAVAAGQPIQVTTLRRDVETDGRRAVVAFSHNWTEDASRRDFTINTLLANEKGQVFDPLGQGLDDLKKGLVRFVGEAATRIAEDYLRILRFFRFHAKYGQGEMDAGALSACKANAAHIAKLSRERITYEFMRILAMDNTVDILEIMFSNNVLPEISHKKYKKEKLRGLIALQQGFAIDLPSRLCVLSGFDIRHLSVLETRILLTSHEKSAFKNALEGLDLVKKHSEHAVRRLVYSYGNSGALRILQLKIVRDDFEITKDNLDLASTWHAPAFPLSGADLKKKGMGEGPAMGKILKATEDWWIDQDFMPDKKACLEQASVLAEKYLL